MGMEPTRVSKEPRVREANEFVDEMKGVYEETESALKSAAEEMKRHYDSGRRPDEFKVGDKVFISTKDLRTDRPNKKLDYKQVGPFEILKKHGRLSYELKLPRSFKVHPVFPAVKLSKAKDDEWNRPKPKVVLKVRDPSTGEFINHFHISSDDFDSIPWRPHPDLFPNGKFVEVDEPEGGVVS